MNQLIVGLEMDPRGNVKAVNGNYGSSNPKVYAAGGTFGSFTSSA